MLLVHLVLETLKNEFALLVLILPNTILRFKLIEFHRVRVVESSVFWVEHMRAKVEHCFLIDFKCLVVYSIRKNILLGLTSGSDLRVILYKGTDSVHEVALFYLLAKVVFAKVGQGDKNVHQHRHWNVLPGQFQQVLHHLGMR